MPTKPLNFRLEPDLIQAIGSAADHLGQSKTEFARRAFRDAIARAWDGRVEVDGEPEKPSRRAAGDPQGERPVPSVDPDPDDEAEIRKIMRQIPTNDRKMAERVFAIRKEKMR